MKLKEAVNRLGFTISKSNRPNEKDIEAFNSILEVLEQTQAQTIQDNLLFAKLYAYNLQEFTRYYKCVNVATGKLNELLSESIDFRIEFLTSQIKQTELCKVITDDFFAILSPKKAREKLKEFPTLEKEFIHIWDFWDSENVTSHLEANVNLTIQKFKNHV
jgi:hypothetical protein